MNTDRTFYKDTRTVEDINASYAGKTLYEISLAEEARFDSIRPEIDKKHAEFASDRRRMLTVKKLIDWLSTQNPDAYVLAYEPNSDAYIEQLAEIPDDCICTVAQKKQICRRSLENWYKDSKDSEQKVQKNLEQMFRYAAEDDIVIDFA